MKKILLAVCLLLVPAAAHARIVDYPGSTTVMQMNDGETNSFHALYSPTAKYSVGYVMDYWRYEEWLMNSVQYARLVKRWNLEDAQANLYGYGALGVANGYRDDIDGETEPAGFGGVAFDAENRRLYASYEARYTEAGDIFGAFEQKARVGFAPYVAEYGSLHAWLILQVDHRPESMRDTLVWTPMVRLFKGDYWLEIGYGDSHAVLVNAMIRF